MIAVIVSAISVLTVVFVSVYLITNSYKQDAERTNTLNKIVKDINNINETNVQMDNTQSKALTALNAKITSISNDMSKFNASVVDMGKTVSVAKTNFVSSSNLVNGLSEKVNALNTNFVSSSNLVNGLSEKVNTLNTNVSTLAKGIRDQISTNKVTLGNNAFSMMTSGDSNTHSLNMAFGDGLSMSLQKNGDGNMSFVVPPQKEFRVYSGSNVNAGITMSGNILGIGKTPQQLQGVPLQVNGAVWTKNGLMTTINENAASVMSFSNNLVTLNPDNDFGGVHVGSSAFLRRDANEWMLRATSSKDANNFVLQPSSSSIGSGVMTLTSEGRMTLAGSNAGISMRGAASATHNPDNLPTQFAFGTVDPKNIIRGDTEVYGDLTSVGSLLLGRPSDESTQQARSGIGQYADNAMRVFTKANGSLHLSTAEQDGTFNDYVTIAKDGQVAMKNILTASALCSGTTEEKQCLTASEIQRLKDILERQST